MKQFLLLLALISLSFSTQISAQNAAGSVEVGVYSAYQFTQFSDGTPEYSGEVDEGKYKATGYNLSGLMEIKLDPMLSMLGIISYENRRIENAVGITNYKNQWQDRTLTEYRYYLSAPQIQVTCLVKRSLGMSKFSILGGGSIGVLFADRQEERYVITDSNIQFPISVDSLAGLPTSKGYTPHFSDESRTSITLYKGPIYQRTALQLGLTAGLQYDLPIYTFDEAAQKFVTLTPSVLFNYNLTTYSDYEKLRAWNVSAGFVLKVGL